MSAKLEIVHGNILGVHASAIRMEDALLAFRIWIHDRDPHFVCVTPVHSIMECYDHLDLRDIFNRAGLVTPDGMPVVWLLRGAGFKQVERVYGPDLLLASCQDSLIRGYRHYFYGGEPEEMKVLILKLQNKFPGINIVGSDSPPFRTLTAHEDQEAVDRICVAKPDIVWIGLGSPRQEYWMSDHIERLSVPVLVGVGAAFNFLSGKKAQAPRCMQRAGLEWFFRLMNEPRRLWRRYLLNYPRFIILLLLQWIRLLKFHSKEI
jgi:N-acetylglucosaminyldiphosphoundecaprenol N-acetyl-beta-D-mannosaminyltransferase